MKWLNATTNKLLLGLLAGSLLLPACKDKTDPDMTTLERPSDFVQSGPGLAKGEPEYIFIADSALDFVTALDATLTYDDIEYVWAPTFYFPMMIPVGPAPSALATSRDGRVVLVASAQLGSVQLLDTANLQMVTVSDTDSRLYSARLVSPDSAIFQLLSLGGCGENCDTFAAISTKMVVKFNLKYVFDTDGNLSSPSVEIADVYPAGDSPIRAVYVPAKEQLWLAQNTGDEILRLDMATGREERFAVGGSQQDIALTPDGDTLFIARAANRVISVYRGAAGDSLTHVVNDSVYMPTDGNSDFGDLFLRDIPWRLTYVTDPAMSISCFDDSDDKAVKTTKYNNYLIAATLRGVTYYFIEDDSNSDEVSYTIADSNACRPRQVLIEDDLADGASWWLEPCDAGKRPGRCDSSSGVVIYPGYRTVGTETIYQIVYEADITLGTGALGRGQIDDQGHFWVDSTIFTPTNFLLRTKSDTWTGDRLVITSVPDTNPGDCRSRYGEAGDYAKRSFILVGVDENGHYITDPQIDPDCFDLGKKGLTYEIQATDSFYVLGTAKGTKGATATRLGRMKAGQSFGPGGDTAAGQGVAFALSPSACSGDSCKQGQTQSFLVQDYFSPMRGAYFSNSSSMPTIGTVPVEMRIGSLLAVVDGEYKYRPLLLMLYSGSGAQTAPGLMLMPSFDSSDLLTTTSYYFFD